MQAAGPMGWGLLLLAVAVFGLAPAAWLLQARVARAVGARPAFGATLWTVLFAVVLWAMLAVAALIATHASAIGSGAPFAALAAALSWLALGVGVRLYLPDPAGAKLAWRRALWAALPAVALLWVEVVAVRRALEWGGLG
ncbi:hypothetical protein GLE_4296 [Lysobacter enzymogenes]|uniref:Uncharacterized protein n=1 Tax=Lysobacter enzymogenes TaxID=69 RepID=A0A0S2DM45_LYSEN|nr:hypothetical protein [Lysobacter enzymogenes]ALN59637.1 hypothetical protein GLE_4296 [Lysobacter enzymogenes]QCW27757.1 hypothetical protein FE772_21025 [Lysobacter enzymogenes]